MKVVLEAPKKRALKREQNVANVCSSCFYLNESANLTILGLLSK
jgi:hypothetical protein